MTTKAQAEPEKIALPNIPKQILWIPRQKYSWYNSKKEVLIVKKELRIMGNDPFFTFPTLELRTNYFSAIQGTLLPYTCMGEWKYCRVEINYQGHVKIMRTNKLSIHYF